MHVCAQVVLRRSLKTTLRPGQLKRSWKSCFESKLRNEAGSRFVVNAIWEVGLPVRIQDGVRPHCRRSYVLGPVSSVFRMVFSFFTSVLPIVLGAVIVFISTWCGRGRGGSRLRSWSHTLSVCYILFVSLDLSHLMRLNEAL